MQLSFASPPAAVARLLAEDPTAPDGTRLAPLETLPRAASHTFSLAGDTPAVPLRPHEQYTIPLQALLAPDPLASRVLTGWRSLEVPAPGPGARGGAVFGVAGAAKSGGAPLVATRLIAYDPAAEKAEVKMLNMGPFGPASVKALADLQSRDVPGTGPHTVRFLLLPPIYVAALWLQGETHRFVPLAPCPPALQAGTIYTEEAFLAALRPLAAAALEFDSSPQQ